MSANILVVEDEPAIQELIAVNLSLAGHHVTRADDAHIAQTLLMNFLPDLVIVDWMMPGQSGVSFIKRLRAEARTRDLPIIMLTARDGEQDKVLGLESGADDYMTKPFSPREMIARISAVLRRRAPHTGDNLIELGGLTLDSERRRVIAGAHQMTLAPTEFRLLRFLMSHPDRVHSRANLLDQVWGDQNYVEERTVDAHVGRLRSVLERSGHHLLIETVRGSGYRFVFSAPG